MSELVERITEAMARSDYADVWDALPEINRRNIAQRYVGNATAAADYMREHFTDHAGEFGFESEQWVQTPKNTGRPLRPGEPSTLGERLRNAGWWIETRFSKTVRDE